MTLRSFDILVSMERLACYPSEQRDAAQRALIKASTTTEGARLAWCEDFTRHAMHYHGEMPPESVTLLMAIAQGHPIDELIEAAS